MTDFDGAYKLLFQHRDVVRDTMVSQFRMKWIDMVDWDTLEPFPTEQISDRRVPTIVFPDEPENEELTGEDIGRQTRRFDDDVWRVRYKETDRWLYFYLAFEFQSTVDRWMAARVQTYRSLLQERIIALNPNAETLPRGVVIVIYNGEEEWDADTSLENVLESMPPGWEAFSSPDAYPLVAMNAINTSELTGEENVFDVVVEIEQSDGAEEGLQCAVENAQWLRKRAVWKAFRTWFEQIMSHSKRRLRFPVPESMWMNLEEEYGMLAQKIRRKYDELEARGEARGKAESILNVLRKRFGPVDEAIDSAVREIMDLGHLTRLLTLALDCHSIDEFTEGLKT